MLSGGNFHGAPLAYAFDYAAIALTDLAGITERRIDRLLNPDINEGLPAFLSPDPGLSSGFMIAQIVAAALINECQVLSHPSSTGTIPTDGGKEDHVSMGMTGAIKLRQIVENAERIVGIELMCAAQGLEFRRPLRPSPRLSVLMMRCEPLFRGSRRIVCWRRISIAWRQQSGRQIRRLVRLIANLLPVAPSALTAVYHEAKQEDPHK